MGMKHYKATNIKWDTDGEDVDLPTEVEFKMDESESPDENGADVLSDAYGFCVNSFNFEEIVVDDDDDD